MNEKNNDDPKKHMRRLEIIIFVSIIIGAIVIIPGVMLLVSGIFFVGMGLLLLGIGLILIGLYVLVTRHEIKEEFKDIL